VGQKHVPVMIHVLENGIPGQILKLHPPDGKREHFCAGCRDRLLQRQRIGKPAGAEKQPGTQDFAADGELVAPFRLFPGIPVRSGSFRLDRVRHAFSRPATFHLPQPPLTNCTISSTAPSRTAVSAQFLRSTTTPSSSTATF